MGKQWIDIIDTAVKIGLGAIISGVFTYLGLRYSHSSEIEKFMLEHKIRILEEISSNLHEYFVTWRYFSSTVGGILKNKSRANEDMSLFTEAQQQRIKNQNSELQDSWPKREAAIAKLMLLKANNVVDAVNECRHLEEELRNRILFDKIVPSHQEHEEYETRVGYLVKKANNEFKQSVSK